MKFHVLAACLAGTLTTAMASAAQDQPIMQDRHHEMQMRSEAVYTETNGVVREDIAARDPYTGRSYHWTRLYRREILFPDLEDERVVAQKVQDIIRQQQQEIVTLEAQAPRAQTAGYSNIETVYEHMINEHQMLVDFASQWLRDRGYGVPAAPAATEVVAVDIEPVASIDQQLAMHQQMFNDALARRRTERSSTVRGLLLWAATGAQNHMSLLNTLERDVERGRKDVSAALRLQLEPTLVASERQQLMEQMVAEETTYLMELQERVAGEREETPAPEPEQPQQEQQPQQPQQPQVIERVIEKPVIVEKERVIERVIEKPVYIERPQEEVQGVRQQTPQPRVRGTRRPAR